LPEHPASPAALVTARQRHQAGDPGQAERLCRQVLQADAGNDEAWLLLGSTLQGQGKAAEAAAAFERSLCLWPRSADSHHGLGQALAGLGRRDEALDHYREAVRLRPDHGEALSSLGLALAGRGRVDDAVPHLRQAALLLPGSAPAHHNLGVALAQQGHPEEAVRALEEALRLRPDHPEACYNLGAILKDLGRREEAIARYRRALELRPGYGEAYNNLGLALTEAGRPDEAVVVLEHAVRLRPQAAEGHNNLGLAHAELGQYPEAEAGYREALRLNPGYVEAHTNLGNAFKEQARLGPALACYQVALWHSPRAAPTRYNRSLALLQAGDYDQGWPEYEWRWQRKQTPARPFRQPRWDGSPLGGRTILLYCEQGLGDAIQFVRFAALVKARGGRVVLECPGFMIPLFSTCAGIDLLVAEGEPLPGFDVQAPLMSLPGLLGTTLATVPAEVPYLGAEPGRVEAWRQRLAASAGLKVGILWQGNPHFQWDRYRSIPLAHFAALAEVDGLQLFSLQKKHGVEQLGAVAGRFPITDLAGELDAEGGAFLDTAAVMKGLDLVVTADTSAAHLAGALGVPVWVALAAVADWRWLCGREDTPWYPTMRLFQQERLGDWGPVFGRMAQALQRLARGERAAVASPSRCRTGADRPGQGPGD